MLTEKTILVNGKPATEIIYNDFRFVIPANDKKFKPDLLKVVEILKKGIDNLSSLDRMQLLNIYSVAFHESGKIEGTCSCDSSATNCKFCKAMREAAEKDPTIICGICYDFAQEQFKIQALNRHSLNLLIMSTVNFSVEELATLPAVEISRINASDDTENEIQAGNMIKYVFAHPYTKAAYWVKNIPAVVAACKRYGKPENLKLVQSSVYINKPAQLAPFFDYVFTVYVDKESVQKAIDSGAMECNGKKCKECGYKCYYGAWPDGANIAKYLKGINKANRKAIMDYIETQGRK